MSLSPSSRSSPASAPVGNTTGSLKRSMGVPALVFFGLSYMVPMTVFTTYGIVNAITGGFLASAYLITLAAMLFTAFSYAAMGRKVRSAGSAYAYARVGLGGGIGFLTGWAVMIDYVLLPMLNYLLIGLYLAERFPSVPAWVFSMLALVLVTALNIVGITVVKSANVVLVLLQVVLHARLAEEHPDGHGWTIDDVAGGLVEKMVRRNPHVFGHGDAAPSLGIVGRRPRADAPAAEFDRIVA